MMRKIAVVLLLVLLALPAAAASRGDDSDTFGALGTRIEKVISFVVHALDDFWPGPPKP